MHQIVTHWMHQNSKTGCIKKIEQDASKQQKGCIKITEQDASKYQNRMHQNNKKDALK